MIKTLRNALKIKDIRTKLIYTFVALLIVRLGCQLPIPGVNRDFFASWFEQQTALSFFDAMTGGSFTQMSIFALNITPYITSSIIMQLLTIAIPKLEEMQKDGEDGRKKIAEYTRYVTVVLAVVESLAMAIGFGNQGLLEGGLTFTNAAIITVSLTAGSAFLMWLGERITQNGVGNGISIILLINIVSRIPNDMMSLYNKFIANASIMNKIIAAVIILAVILAMVIFIIILQDGERKIPVQYAKKVQGRKLVGGQSSHIPLKVNTAGVIPVIFASSLLSFPIVIASFMGISPASGAGASLIQKLLKVCNQGAWCNFTSFGEFKYTLGLLAYIVLVIFFAYFYTSITFNPIEVSNNMKKQGGFIPGIRPGKPTTDYLTKVLNNIIFIGAVGLTIVAVVPIFFSGAFGANVSFSGTSLIIIVGVILETMKQIESMMLVRHYKGFLND
ncbi:preprotein translocase subunit SecY [Acetivibrio ethanolgignens]|uniref:Protein translocase subunit SecY n=1 Tax=Acetivibrio ethanolgignens TaxID=290052 RepID=A0A0V8QG74_9FIRM|nr:preprotein translocase subunit SecY [Acetivibrio ethanolgignens]KSV59611.1 preprotein translocase subunit SecY [Acetivibrio ethanolgignens]